jgi:hypothetical protein
MSSKREVYFYLDSQGKCSLPSHQEVKDSDLNGKPFILIPDNNVCIHLSEFDRSKKDKTKQAKVNEFLNYCIRSDITIVPAFGLTERASIPGTLELNKDKLIYSENIFWQKLGHYVDNDRLSKVFSTNETLKAILYPFYAYLLMIKLILLKREPSRENIEKNIQDLYGFVDQIGFFLALPWQFALAIFGGKTELNKFITPKKSDTFKALWGAAWDLYYIQLTHQFNGTREIIKGILPRFILVTDDVACATIGDFAKVNFALDCGSIIYDCVEINSDFPHLKKDSSFLHEINLKLNATIVKRAYANSKISELDQQENIENSINTAYSLIQELTKKVNHYEKKGFG